MPIKIWHNGAWVETDDVYAWSPASHGVRQVLAAYVWTTLRPNNGIGPLHWEVVFDNYQEPPKNLRGITATHSTAEIAWDAANKADEYQILMRTVGDTTNTIRYMPSVQDWTREVKWTWVGLLADKTYTFTVKARRRNQDGSIITSNESKSLSMSTGHPPSPVLQNPEYPASRTAYVTASRSNTWNNDQKWASTTSGDTSDVVQGYFTYPVRNNYGCVYYGGVYSQLSAAYGAAVADHIEVTDAKINRIYRKSGGAGNPRVDVYASKLNFSSTARPDNVGTGTSFTAPDEGAVKDNFDFADTNKLKVWAQAWADRSTAHNGLLMFRTGGTGSATYGYNGFTILREANAGPYDWRLVLSIRWRYQTAVDVPAKFL